MSGKLVLVLNGAMNTAEFTGGEPFTDDCKGPAGVPGVPGLYVPTSPEAQPPIMAEPVAPASHGGENITLVPVAVTFA
jgi:hypothetical protein